MRKEEKILPAWQVYTITILPCLYWFENKIAETDQLANMQLFMFGIVPNKSCIIKSN